VGKLLRTEGDMRTKLLLVLAVVAAAATAFVASASATTAPTLIMKVQVKFSDNSLTLTHVSAKRGWAADFIVRNTGKKPHQFYIGGLETKPIKPGGRAVLKVNFELRGVVSYKDALNEKIKGGVFTVS